MCGCNGCSDWRDGRIHQQFHLTLCPFYLFWLVWSSTTFPQTGVFSACFAKGDRLFVVTGTGNQIHGSVGPNQHLLQGNMPGGGANMGMPQYPFSMQPGELHLLGDNRSFWRLVMAENNAQYLSQFAEIMLKPQIGCQSSRVGSEL